jgi:hypothetical protein
MPVDLINDAITSDIIEKWGIVAQVDVAIEECAEFIIELAKMRGHDDIRSLADGIKKMTKKIRLDDHVAGNRVDQHLPDETKHCLAEEMVDVHIMIEQLIRVFLMTCEFDKIHEEKRERLCKRLQNE